MFNFIYHAIDDISYRKMDAKLSFLFDHSHDFFCVLDWKGTILYANASLKKLFGYSEAEIKGKKTSDFAHPADIKRIQEFLKKLATDKKFTGYEIRIRAKNGRYYNISWSFYVNDADGLLYATGVNSVHKLNGRDKLNITDSIQHIIQSFNEGFFIINSQWQVTSFNPAFQAITGLTTEQLSNVNFRHLTNLGISGAVMAGTRNCV